MNNAATTVWAMARDRFSRKPYLKHGYSRAFFATSGELRFFTSDGDTVDAADIERLRSAHRKWVATKNV